MRHLRLVVEYDGSAYSGWQLQPNAVSIQQVFLETLHGFLPDAHRLAASGRTDAGVHALGQVVTFRTEGDMPLEIVIKALNAQLPRDITVRSGDEVPLEFDVVRHARGKLYRYRIHNAPTPSALRYNRVWHRVNPLDLAAMRDAAAHLVGEHDFASFRTAGSDARTSIRNLARLDVTLQDAEEIWVEAYSNGFLRGMVRNLVGTLVQVGSGRRPPDEIPTILAALDRTAAGPSAPPYGLYLIHVDYNDPA